ncbi:MAG: prepilin-type N-terminal cleavage/methylation domain-containing protein, partial [Phycisphaerales bacterium]|nr:prepilin-type N-terminal cleavage/methylation domain-containing protein [Phycisphaerales bacterium]
ARSAFTLLEMLVVIVVILILIIIAIPAFNTIIRTQEETTADAVVGAGVGLARDLARAGTGQGDVAAVFAFEPGGRTSIIVCQRVGEVADQDNAGVAIRRDVFVPVEGYEIFQLPAGWSVRGYALAQMVDANWYERPTTGGGAERYPTNLASWVFPETGFFDHATQEDAGARQTFMVRFEAGTGRAAAAGGKGAIVVLQRASGLERNQIAPADEPDNKDRWKRLDLAASTRRWALRVIAAPASGQNSLTPDERRRLIGDISGDTALAKNVTSVAIYNEKRLADALGVRLNPITESVYFADADQQNNGRRYQPRLVDPIASDNVARRNINRWIEGWQLGTDERDTSLVRREDTTTARVYLIPPVTGPLQPVALPSSNPNSVGGN